MVNREVTSLIRREVPERILLVEMHPRAGKSEFISRWTPAWFVQEYPDRLAGVCSYNGRFARQWGRRARQSFQDAFEFHGRQIDRRRDGAAEWGCAGLPRGGMIASGVNEALTGRGLGLLVVDDPIKNSQQAQSENYRQQLHDWWQSTAFTRLDPKGVVIVVCTRWHDEDLIGYLLKKAETGEGLAVRRLRIPALCEDEEIDPLERRLGEAMCPELGWDEERLADAKRGMVPYWWNALYQQRPGQSDRAAWPDSYFGESIWAEQPAKVMHSVISIDPSKGKDQRKGDYPAVCRVSWAQNKFWVQSRIRREPAEAVCAAVVEMIEQQPVDMVYIEGNAGGHLFDVILRAELAKRHVIPPPIVTPDSSEAKEDRIDRLGPHLEQGAVRFANTADNRLLVRQLKEYPEGDYDDGPDALEHGIGALNQVALVKTMRAKQIDEIVYGR